MIAATAIANDLPLYTCNPGDVDGIDDVRLVALDVPPIADDRARGEPLARHGHGHGHSNQENRRTPHSLGDAGEAIGRGPGHGSVAFREAVTYAIVYVEHGDLVADFEDYEAARSALSEFVSEHPEVLHRVGILPFDEDGVPGEFEPAAVAGGFANPFTVSGSNGRFRDV